MFILRWAGILFSCHLAFSSVSTEARSVQRSNGEMYRGSDNDAPAPLGQQQQATTNSGTPTVLLSRLSTEIIVRRYVVSDNNLVDRVAESDRTFTPKDPVDYLIAAQRDVSAVPSTSPCPTPSAPVTTTVVPCANLFVQCSASNTAPASTKARDITIVVAVFLLLCLAGTVFLVHRVRGKMANTGDAETTSKPGGDLRVTPYIVPPSASDISLPTYQPGQGNLGHVGSPKLQSLPQRVASGGRTKLISVQSRATPSSATSPYIPVVESNSQLSRSNARQEHIHQQQRELDNRLRAVQQEMVTLQANLSSAHSRRMDHIARENGNAGDGTESDITVREVRELVRELEDQIASLQAHQGIVLASHQVVEPPPGYQPSPLTQPNERPGEQSTK